jgi:hypothetical protein
MAVVTLCVTVDSGRCIVYICPNCGEDVPTGSAFCNHCGFSMSGTTSSPPVNSGPKGRWEYKDLRIDFPSNGFSNVKADQRGFDAVCERGDKLILTALSKEGEQGWQPEGATDFRTLAMRKKITSQDKTSYFSNVAKYTFLYTIIRLRRLV